MSCKEKGQLKRSDEGKCPDGRPHYWLIDSRDYGICKFCGEERDFRKLQERANRLLLRATRGTKMPERKGGRKMPESETSKSIRKLVKTVDKMVADLLKDKEKLLEAVREIKDLKHGKTQNKD